jgi:hypothetical protein
MESLSISDRLTSSHQYLDFRAGRRPVALAVPGPDPVCEDHARADCGIDSRTTARSLNSRNAVANTTLATVPSHP